MKYDIVLADPPWRYNSGGAHSGKYEKLKYKTMSIKEICDLPVINNVNDNAALFLWCTSSHLPFASVVMESWGFKYIRVDSVWEKITKNWKPAASCGPWGMNEVEYLLMGVRGRMMQHNKVRNFNTCVACERVKNIGKVVHSAKPEIFRERIEKRFPDLDFHRLEMFARHRVPGWDVFGDQVEGSIVL
jgi:site-specific DNA-methyltransferase (adenine-specific)